MSVVIIGAGNVATVFGRLIKKANMQVVQVISRNIANAQLLANELNCPYSADLKNLNTTADIYVVAISDASLNENQVGYFLGEKLILHTAGSVSKNILHKVSTNYGVIYPLQSLRKEMIEIPKNIPLLIDGSSEEVIERIEKFAFQLSSSVIKSTDEERLKLHVAAVIVSNFTNHLYSLAATYCEKENLDFKMLQPLIEETALRVRFYPPAEMQTGPAIRKDNTTLEKHLRLLSNHPALKKVYLKITDSIMNP